MATTPAARVLAFHLPQFHAIAENDEWWGDGFTEWTNVRKGRPLFPGHRQPVMPGELGYYNLLDPGVQQRQADLARAHGVEGFVYWHYWFAGKRLLERVVDDIHASGQPDLPFALAWANESWTGVWHGAPHRMLMEQTYPGIDDHRAHLEALLPAFHDPRYVRIDGRPLFYVFKPQDLPDRRRVLEMWREQARASGLPDLYLVGEAVNMLGDGHRWRPDEVEGFDAVVTVSLPTRFGRAARRAQKVTRRLLRRPVPLLVPATSQPLPPAPALGPTSLPCVLPNWDNTPRSAERGIVLLGSTPRRFEAHVRAAVQQVQPLPPDERIVFVKSWNEWAEGNHLEPCERWGRGYLEAVSDAVLG